MKSNFLQIIGRRLNKMLEPNISDENGFMRLICGITSTGIGIAKISRVPSCKVGHTLILLGAMKIAEGIYQYCPLVAMTKQEEEM